MRRRGSAAGDAVNLRDFSGNLHDYGNAPIDDSVNLKDLASNEPRGKVSFWWGPSLPDSWMVWKKMSPS